MEAEVVKDDVFPPSRAVTCRIAYPQQIGSGMFLGVTGHLLHDAEECFCQGGTLPFHFSSPIGSTGR